MKHSHVCTLIAVTACVLTLSLHSLWNADRSPSHAAGEQHTMHQKLHNIKDMSLHVLDTKYLVMQCML